jgi:hypothetical protein
VSVHFARSSSSRWLFVALILVAPAIHQLYTPGASASQNGQPIVAMLIERVIDSGYVDLGEPGPSAGDLYTWGPNPLFDSENVIDTGARVQGSCIALNVAADCYASETTTFVLGGILEARGVMRSGGPTSLLTITGGTVNFRGATGNVAIAPRDDPRTWLRTYRIWVAGA